MKSTKTVFNIDFQDWNTDEEVIDAVKMILEMRDQGLEQGHTWTGDPITKILKTGMVLSFHDCSIEEYDVENLLFNPHYEVEDDHNILPFRTEDGEDYFNHNPFMDDLGPNEVI